ncbi:thyroid receptor-interacting protein 11 isoform X2 [Scaptodrosophila lebanonensis]|uniref:Thyroid receptor-interacting protein 11 isoform X2 n=1 Tax=Drosophila lebanonensis TaxID=7225 RepID=A0A6J2TSE9_DROLE|nr:thyroid receptor-interacting protein 11 isoform X2 [Scaptodrosophila lebanonensis]
MSWLNNSLNSIKGQLTNLAQEVLAETAGPGDEDYRGPEVNTKTALELLAETQQQKEQLDRACEDKDREIAALRKQISKLQSQKISDSGGGAGGDTESTTSQTRHSSKSHKDEQNPAILEDSWCWEPDSNQAADASSSTSAGAGLVDVALDADEKNAAKMKERIAELEQLNVQLNASLDELDAQHEQAMQDMLAIKTQLQEKVAELTQANSEMKQHQADSFIAHELALAKLQEQCRQSEEAQQVALVAQDALQKRVDGYAEELKRSVVDLADLQELLDKRSADNNELIERIRLADASAEAAAGEREQLQQRVTQLLKDVEELKLAKEKKTSESSNSSSTGKHSEDEFIVVREADAASGSSDPTTPPTKEKLRDKLVALEARIAELTLENGSLALKLQDRELEKQLSSNVLSETLEELQQKHAVQSDELAEIQAAKEQAQQALAQLQTEGGEQREQAQKCVAELESRLLISESEKEQLQLELQTLRNEWERKLQQLTLQNQELKLQAEAEEETHADDVERQMSALREANERLRQELNTSIAQAKFRQAIAEEKQEITDLDEADDGGTAEPFDIEQLRVLLESLLKGQLEQTPQEALERGYRALRERWQRVNALEQRLVQTNEELAELQDHKLIAEHEKKTLEADISQYILQCDELMKNNEVLLNELEKYKRNKLETIEERHEETIVQLETQLEEATRRCRQLQNSEEELARNLSEARQRLDQAGAEKREETVDNELAIQKERYMGLQAELIEKERAFEKELAEKNEICHRLEEKLAHQSTREEVAKQHEEHYNTKLKQLEEYKESSSRLGEQLTELRSQLSAKEQSLAQLQQQLEEQLGLVKELTEHKNRCRLLEDQLAQLKAELTAKEQMAVQREKEQDDVAKELVEYKEHCSELQAQLSGREQAIAQLQQQNEEQHSELTKCLTEQQERNAALQAQLTAIGQSLQKAETELSTLQATQGHCQDKAQLSANLQKTIEQLGFEKAEMIKALQQKHAENTQYYAEIQRLQPLAAAAAAPPPTCARCPQLDAQLDELFKEREKLTDQINFLKEKSDILTTNLLTEQTNQRLLQQEKVETLEQHTTAMRDLERLRAHLIEVEELHTQETVELQQELHDVRSKMLSLQEEVSKSSTAFTSASIRANQQAETLQAQHALVLKQRDELLHKLSQCEDRELKQHAALTNLQCALEQFQNDKDHDIQMATQRIRKELQSELDKQIVQQAELAVLHQKLADANQGLRAAARLSDQLETSQQTIAVLRDEVDSLKEHNGQLEQKLSSSESSQTDKIDKSLIKSLLIGYVVSGHAGDKQQVLRMISSLLDFSAQEADKVGLNKPQSSWLGAILGSNPGQTAQGTGRDNLMQAFVQFLEQESQPQSQSRPTLLSMADQATGAGSGTAITGTGTGTSTTVPSTAPTQSSAEQPARRPSNSSAVPPAQPLLISSNEFAPTRNSSSILKDILSDS